MKRKDKKDMINKTQKELDKMLQKKRLELTKSKIDIKAGKEKNLKKAKNIRAEIAQILTLIKQKELIEMEAIKEEGDK